MTDSLSLNLKPGAAILMALALITTTFAGVTYADPADGSGGTSTNTMLSIDYDLLEIHVNQFDNGSAVGTMTATIVIYDDNNFSVTLGPEDLMAESNTTSWNTHYSSFDLSLFFQGNATLGPMAEEGVWYHVDASVNDDEGNIGSDHMDICMENGSVCELDMGGNNTDSGEEEMMFQMADLNGDGNVSIDEYIAVMEDSSNETIDNQSKNMITNLFMAEDIDGDQELNIDEFSSFMEAMKNVGEGGEDEYSEMEFWMFTVDTNQDGNISLTEILSTMIEETDDSELMTTFFTNLFNNEDVDENALLDAGEFAVFIQVLKELYGYDCYQVMAGDIFMEEGEMEDEGGNYTYYMVGDTAPSNGTYCVDSGMDSDAFLYMYDTNGDDHLSLTEILAAMSDENSTSMDLMIIGWMFESYDDNSDQLLGPNEFGEFIDRMENEYDYQPTPVQMMELMDTDGDGSVSMDEIVLWISAENEEPMSEIEKEYLGIMFMMFDADANAMLNASEFPDFYYAMQSQDHDNGGDDGGETNMVCYDMVNHVVVGGYTDATSCEAAGYMWADMSQSPGGDDQNNTDTEDEGDEIDFMNINVMFEQWHDDSMELVIIELAVIDNAEDIARLSMMADSMYGNNDSVLDESEVDMLMALYAMNLDIDDISEGMTLDGQNGTAVDFWVEIDGLLEGDDVVFIRVGTVIEFPTTAYDNSTTHTFIVMDEEEGHSDDSMEDSMEDSENCQDFTVWIHNSDTWNIASATGFIFEETNNAWYADECALDDQESLKFILSKVENATLPTEEDDDWTWEDEEMNMFPVCDWYYAVTFANGSMMEDQWMQDAPESGDYMIMLMDNASYDIYVKCWDPEQGKMVVDITSPLGNSSNTSLGYAMGYISFKLPAGTGGNVTFDVTWTDGYYTESGTLTVYATGDGTIDLSDIEVAESEGLLPGFTAAMGVLAMLGAAMIAGRRNRA